MSVINGSDDMERKTTSPTPQGLRINEIDNENDFVPLSDSDDEVTNVSLVPTAAEIEAETKAEALEEAEAYDDYDGHYDNPTESTTPVPVSISHPSTVSSAGSKNASPLQTTVDSVELEQPVAVSKVPENVPTISKVSNISKEESKIQVETTSNENNELTENNDFIAFSASESEDEGAVEKPHITTDDNQELEDEEAIMTDFPWIVNHDHSKQKEVADWLTLEIKDFVSYISPSKTEIESRNITIGKIRSSVKALWPDADLHVFGSYATDLYLPGSDIDCVINSKSGDKDNRNALYQLANHLSKDGLAIDVEVISKARVPIIKFVEPESRIHIDISFERTNGVDAAKLIRSWLDSTPGLRELVLIVKQFLHARKLNNVHTGGLGGFSIICLVFSFLHMHPRIVSREILAKDNLGVLLIDFFELYGKNFGYDDVAISVLNGEPSYLPKRSWKDLYPIRNSFSLAIQDPGDSTNNISRGSFNIRDIKKAFAGTFDMLTNQCFELNEVSLKGRSGKSILGSVIKYRGKQRNFKDERKLVVNKAIIENEEFHNKRSRDEMEDDYDVTATLDTKRKRKGKGKKKNSKMDENIDVSGPSKKKQKRKEKKSKKPKKRQVEESDDGYVPLDS
ncbi:similar to Saccharomyces cerevisiae YOL115W PAP2 Non-canonical poly(A) polymerase, involved in nuclear RNA degradation as a component of the TRAMP complex [Maudiozyma saulgeensis]|uniref:polynucleotide adenylyltransferase n=1 Tax=Maudiozyma saulgeensis TaxID=1789683 RepID=A0A1X7RA39_9SACH|nr:similar to Saccharomyces cerevisiae YOL115W PAP2 Non-canonical poly(A) polymerase, involved in nuclear RNA degradation as a component of the TRAMP complex [Kazachstania saulgeensis]